MDFMNRTSNNATILTDLIASTSKSRTDRIRANTMQQQITHPHIRLIRLKTNITSTTLSSTTIIRLKHRRMLSRIQTRQLHIHISIPHHLKLKIITERQLVGANSSLRDTIKPSMHPLTPTTIKTHLLNKTMVKRSMKQIINLQLTQSRKHQTISKIIPTSKILQITNILSTRLTSTQRHNPKFPF